MKKIDCDNLLLIRKKMKRNLSKKTLEYHNKKQNSPHPRTIILFVLKIYENEMICMFTSTIKYGLTNSTFYICKC